MTVAMLQKWKAKVNFQLKSYVTVRPIFPIIISKLKLSQKSIDYVTDIKPSGESQYQIRKKEFEKKNFFIKDIFVHVNEDGTLEYLKPSVMELQQKCNHYSEYDPVLNKSVRKFFFHEWLEDPDRAKFEKIDFIPDLNLCPSYTYNLFKGFQGDKYQPSREFTDAEFL
jgi:hypothetical protein